MKKIESVLIIGGNGFIGTEVLSTLDSKFFVKVLSRRTNGSEKSIQADITDYSSLENLSSEKFDLVINCVGISPIKYHKDDIYISTQYTGVKNILKFMDKIGCSNLIHISAIGSDEDSDFIYMKTKHQSELLVKESNINYLIIRPSLVLGDGSDLEEILKSLSLFGYTVLPKFGGLFQPISVKELSTVIGIKVKEGFNNEILEIGDKESMQLSEVLKRNASKIGIRALLLPMPKLLFNTFLQIGSLLHIVNKGLSEYVWKNSIAQGTNRYIGKESYFD